MCRSEYNPSLADSAETGDNIAARGGNGTGRKTRAERRRDNERDDDRDAFQLL